MQLAHYPPGSRGYCRHADASLLTPYRTVTAIYYPNIHWTGQMQITSSAAGAHVDGAATLTGAMASMAPKCAASHEGGDSDASSKARDDSRLATGSSRFLGLRDSSAAEVVG